MVYSDFKSWGGSPISLVRQLPRRGHTLISNPGEVLIIIIICKALNSRTGSDQKCSAEINSTGFEFGVFLPPGRCLTRLMRPPPQDLKIGVYLLLDSCLTRIMRLSPQDLKSEYTIS